ncbi:hypothetical protein ON010_g16713 [Phytophthora cinnamomi]|nr:hypothetical protein ON010_g16713 [Phytophthora cinnamomi]
MAQKGFRAFNGCHEHNFVATTLLDQSRRLHRKLYQVWYDLRNAFGSLPQELMWRVLRDLGVDRRFIQRCKDIYAGSAFAIGNAADGATDPVRQEVGVYQGCPLSPLLFIVALVPFLRRLEQLDGVGVPLVDGVRLRTTAYADDLKVFSDSAAGIRKCHGVVARFLTWTGLRANPAKCASPAVTTNARGNLKRDASLQLEVHDEAIATLSLQDSYRYLGGGRRVRPRPPPPPARTNDPADQTGGGGAHAVGAGAVAGGEGAQDIRLPQGRWWTGAPVAGRNAPSAAGRPRVADASFEGPRSRRHRHGAGVSGGAQAPPPTGRALEGSGRRAREDVPQLGARRLAPRRGPPAQRRHWLAVGGHAAHPAHPPPTA